MGERTGTLSGCRRPYGKCVNSEDGSNRNREEVTVLIDILK